MIQAAVDRGVHAQVWQEIVRAKVRGQAATLSVRKPRLGKSVGALVAEVGHGDMTNVEGRAAREYFDGLWGKKFVRDHDGGDRVNALLNYGYAILRSSGIRAVNAAGLVPSLGIWHRHRANAFNLVSDLMEPFRPVLDHVVRNLPGTAKVTQVETKKALAGVLEIPFGSEGRTVADELLALALRYARFIEGERQGFHVDHWAPLEGGDE